MYIDVYFFRKPICKNMLMLVLKCILVELSVILVQKAEINIEIVILIYFLLLFNMRLYNSFILIILFTNVNVCI